MFEKEYREIIELLKRNEDYTVMRSICENIIDVLKENGVKVDGIIKNVTRTKTFAVVDDFEIKFNGLDFAEHDKRYVDEIKALKKQISELESELAVKEDLMKIMRCHIDGMGVGNTEALKKFGIDITADDEEPLPFSSDEYEECLEEELEDLRERHQQDCITINQLHTTIDTLVDRYAKLREMRGL